MSEHCYFCGKPELPALYLRDKKGDHPVCKNCADAFLESDQEWPIIEKKNDFSKYT